jgi:hypothetical protein
MERSTDPRTRRLLLLLLALYPVLTALLRPEVFFTPFDSETVTRFVEPYLFEGRAEQPVWTLTESFKWGLTRPLYSLTFLGDFLLWHADARFYHLTDALLAWIAFCLAARLLVKNWGIAAGGLAALLWAMLPSQAWSLYLFTGRNDRLMSIPILLAISLYDAWLDGRRRSRGALMAVPALVLLGFLAKENALSTAPLIFAWGWLARGRGFVKTVREGLPAWIGCLLLFPVLFGIRALAGIALSDAGTFNTGTAYLTQFGDFVLQGLHFHHGVPLLAAGGISILLMASGFLIPSLPGMVRFGCFAMLVTIAPFPLVWIQRSFHWLPSLGLAITAAGLLAWAGRTSRRAKSFALVLGVVMAVGVALWGRIMARRICAEPIAFKVGMEVLEGSGRGPGYDGRLLLDSVPALREPLGFAGEGCPQHTAKARNYVANLLQVATDRADVWISWPCEGGISPPRPGSGSPPGSPPI